MAIRPSAFAVCLVALGAFLSMAAQPAAQPASGVRWAWSGGVTAHGAVVKARVARGGMPVRLLLTRADSAGATGPALPSKACVSRSRARDGSAGRRADGEGAGRGDAPGYLPGSSGSQAKMPPSAMRLR